MPAPPYFTASEHAAHLLRTELIIGKVAGGHVV